MHDRIDFMIGGGNRAAGFLHATNLENGRLLWRQADREWTTQQNLVIAELARSINDDLRALAETLVRTLGKLLRRYGKQRAWCADVTEDELYRSILLATAAATRKE